MKNASLRSHLLIGLMFIVSFAAAWLPISLVRAWSGKRSNPGLAELLAQGGVSGDMPVAPEPDLGQFPAEQLAQWWDRPAAGPDEPVEVMVELEEASAIDAYLQAQPDGASFDKHGDKQAAPQAVEAAQSQLARIERAQQKLAVTLTGSEFNARITGQVQRVFNGIGLQVAAGRLREIRRLPGVKALHILKPMYLTTETSVPFIGAPQVWQGGSGIPGATGEGVKVAVLDTGIDYIHVNFGGSGNAADYAANNPTVIGDVPGFPGVKIAGGHDFVGNAYNAASSDPNLRIPRPDPDPVDCYGHGTGTASIVAGFGVTPTGATYTGPYNLTTHSNPFRIGPGVAPNATIYSYKIYGCDPRGGTNGAVVALAIERALDPNGDGNFADRVDVILLPFSGSFGVLLDAPEVVAINRAAQLGVVAVGAAGNGGETYYAVGSPSAAPDAVSVAASHDDGFFFQKIQITSPSNIAGNYPAAVSAIGPSLGGEITGNLVVTSPNDGCAPLTNAAAVNGNIAFVENTGNCTRTTKVRNAQNAGAKAVIIANNVATLPQTLLDDGTGFDIRIPSFLLNKDAGDLIRSALATFAFTTAPVTGSISPVNPDLVREFADVTANFSSRGGSYYVRVTGSTQPEYFLKPNITAPGVNIRVAKSGTGNEAGFFTGTSMAAPHAAGAIVNLVTPSGANEFHGNAFWAHRSQALKANEFFPDLADPGRAGFGRIFIKPGPGGPIIREGAGFFTNPQTFEVVRATSSNYQLFRLENPSGTSATYNVSYNQTSDIPGVDLSFPSTVTVPANGNISFNLGIAYTPSAMKHLRDNTISATQSGQPRHWLSEESGYFTLTPQSGGNPFSDTLRYLFQAPYRPASDMKITQDFLNLLSSIGAFNLNLTGTEVRTGSNFPTDEISIASALELLEISPNDSQLLQSLKFADLQHIGARSNFPSIGNLTNTIIQFGVSTYDDWQTPNQFSTRVFIDTNRDGADDFEAFTTSFPNEQGAPSDVFFTRLRNIQTGTFSSELFLNIVTAAQYNTVPFNTNVMVLGVRASSLNLNPANARFNFRVAASYGGVIVDQSRTLSFDPTKPGLNFGNNSIFFDLNNTTIPVNYNLSDFRANASEGALLLHHHNTEGNRAQILPANLGFEGDVEPRPGGNGSNTNADWLQVGRFAAGLDEANLGNEFQRADSAPRGSSGNGQITVADWVQAGRYAAGLDPVAPAAGPVTPPPGSAPEPSRTGAAAHAAQSSSAGGALQGRVLRIVNTTIARSQSGAVTLELDAQGNENALGFSLSFDPAQLSFVSAVPGGGASGAVLNVNPNQAAQGRLGFALALPAGQTFAAGTRQIIAVTFAAAANGPAAMTSLGFGDQLVPREAADANAGVLTATYIAGTVNLACITITVNPATLPNGFIGAGYNQTVSATGGLAPYTFSLVIAGSLPPGLSLDMTTGALTGMLNAVGVFTFTIAATDANNCVGLRQYTVVVSGTGLMFYPLPRPLRLLDTRPDQSLCDNIGVPITGGTSINLQARATCQGVTIPVTAQAVVGNVTVINQTAQFGFLTLFPAGQMLPLAANIIYEPNQLLSNNFTVGLNASGEFSTFAERTLHTVIDVSGYFAPPTPSGLYYHALPRPLRLMDTRADQSLCDNVGLPITGGTALTTQARISCNGITIPTAAQAIVGNATVINQTASFGFLTLFPSGQTLPLAANMIYAPNQLLANAFTVGLSANGQFDTFAERTLHLVIDVAGYYSTEANDANGPGLLFNPLPRPLRLLDTRPDQSLCDSVGVPITGGTSLTTQARISCNGITIPAAAQAVNGNITVINQTASFGFLTLFPAGQTLPLAANMIYAPSQLLANAFVVGLSAMGEFNTFGERTIHVVVDVSGYFAP